MKVDKKIIKKNSNWNFKGNVYKYFDKHIKKSIPFYSEAQNLYAQYTDFFLQDKSKIIDLGSSTGVFLDKVYLISKGTGNPATISDHFSLPANP